MEVPRRHPALIPADLGQESSARKNGGREEHGGPLLIPTNPAYIIYAIKAGHRG